MGRPKGSTNKTAKKKVPTAQGPKTTDHNQAKGVEDLTDDQRAHLLLSSVPKYQQALDAKQKAAAHFLEICRKIKGDGVSIDDIKTALLLQTPKGEAAVKAQIEAQIRVARWTNAPLGAQFGLFEDRPDDPKPEEETRSFRAGKEIGAKGSPAKCPPEYDMVEWTRGWHVGQAALLSTMKAHKTANGASAEAAE